MKFVSKKDMIFMSIILLVVIVFSLFEGSDAMQVNFEENIVSITATGFDFNIAYADVEKLELTTVPELGTLEKGTDTSFLRCGNWSNAIWGDYHLCVTPGISNCVVVSLRDGRTIVFNYQDEDGTQNAYTLFQEQLDKLN